MCLVAIGMKLSQRRTVTKSINEWYTHRRSAPRNKRREFPQRSKAFGCLDSFNALFEFAVNNTEADNLWFVVVPPRNENHVSRHYHMSEFMADLLMAPVVRPQSHKGRPSEERCLPPVGDSRFIVSNVWRYHPIRSSLYIVLAIH